MAAAISPEQVRQILVMLREQRDLCARLGELSDCQRDLITGEAADRLLSVLSERQTLLDRLSTLGARLRPLQQRWREIRACMDAASAEAADRLVAEVNALLSAVLVRDEADAQLLSARRQVAGQEIAELRQTRVAGSAYARASAGSGSHVDWTDE